MYLHIKTTYQRVIFGVAYMDFHSSFAQWQYHSQ